MNSANKIYEDFLQNNKKNLINKFDFVDQLRNRQFIFMNNLQDIYGKSIVYIRNSNCKEQKENTYDFTLNDLKEYTCLSSKKNFKWAFMNSNFNPSPFYLITDPRDRTLLFESRFES